MFIIFFFGNLWFIDFSILLPFFGFLPAQGNKGRSSWVLSHKPSSSYIYAIISPLVLLFVRYLTSPGTYLTTSALPPPPPYLPPCLLPSPLRYIAGFQPDLPGTVPRHFSFPGPPLPAKLHIPSGRFLGSDRDFMAVILQPPSRLSF